MDNIAKLNNKEIAKIANVSESTVSIVLNGKPGVSDKTRQKIAALLQENGYEIASSVPVKKLESGTILFCKIAKHGQIVNDRHNAFLSDYMDGIIEEAKNNYLDVQVDVFNCVSLQNVYEEINSYKDIVGCIILSTEFSQTDLELFASLNIPFVFLDTIFEFAPFDFVTMDNENMVFDMLKHFKNKGHNKIGMFYSVCGGNFLRRKSSFIKAIENLGLEFKQDWMFEVGSTLESSRADVLEKIKQCRELPTAFFASNDIVAIGAIESLQSLGFKIPKDIAIGGFDDIPAGSFIDPPLTTISVPKFDIGKLSVSALLRQIKQGKIYSQKTILSGELIIRETT